MRPLLASLLAPAIIITAPVQAQTASLATISAHLRGISTMTADFVQTESLKKRSPADRQQDDVGL